MSTIEEQRVAAVRKLEQLGYTFAAGDWMHPADEPAAVIPAITDQRHALLVARADQLTGCPEESSGAREPEAIIDAIEAYDARDHQNVPHCRLPSVSRHSELCCSYDAVPLGTLRMHGAQQQTSLSAQYWFCACYEGR